MHLGLGRLEKDETHRPTRIEQRRSEAEQPYAQGKEQEAGKDEAVVKGGEADIPSRSRHRQERKHKEQDGEEKE
jgi:hypothetical protein